MTRKEQKEYRRNQILQVALHLFIHQGYHGTKTSQISREAKISEGLLFHYFPTKESLLEELVKMGVYGMQYPMRMDSVAPLDFFQKFTVQLLQYLKENIFTAELFVLMAQMQRTEEIPVKVKELAASVDVIGSAREVILAGQSEGTIRQGDALALSNLYWCCIQGVVEQYVARPRLPLPEPEWIVAMLKAES
ncbi:MAG: TetR/AcrR family transcriptional regulator [Lachnospiraceae bacterium]|nr:TetR/AcrR family transcriptional regulator [Lachnospiraceae bacterium]